MASNNNSSERTTQLAADATSKQRCAPLQCVHHAVTHAVDTSLGRLGHFTARHPCVVALLAIICSVILMMGVVVHFEFLSDAEEIWPPQDSKAIQDKEFVRYHISIGSEPFEGILIVLKDPYQSILERDVLLAFLDAYNATATYTVGGLSWLDTCMLTEDGSRCYAESVLAHWEYNATLLQNDPDIVATVTSAPYPDGSPASPTDVGREDGVPVALRLKLYVHAWRRPDGTDIEVWREGLIEFVQSWDYPQFDAYIMTDGSLEAALDESVTGDITIVGIGIGAMLLFSYSVMTRRLDGVRSRVALTCVGALAVILGAGAAFGLVSACGVPVTSLNQVLLYITLGIGIDDAFIITSCVDAGFHEARKRAKQQDQPDPGAPGNDAQFAAVFSRSVAQAASSIAFTSLTDLAAFFLGSFTRIPAVRWFCLYAGTSVVCVFLVQITLFAAFLAVDTKRQARARLDVFCCCARSTAGLKEVPPQSFMQRMMKRYYAPFIIRDTRAHVCVVISFLAAAVVLGLGIGNIRQGLPLVDLAPDDHFARDYLMERNLFWPGVEYTDVQIVFMHSQSVETGDTPASALQVQLGMYAARHAVAGETKYVQDVPDEWWLAGFLTYASQHPTLNASVTTAAAPWANAGGGDTVDVFIPTANGTSFGTAVASFLQDDDTYTYRGVVSLEESDDGNYALLASACPTVFIGQKDEQMVVHGMQDVRNVAISAAAVYGVEATIFNHMFVFTEMDAIVVQETIQNMSLALVGVTFACLVFLGSVSTTLLVVLMITLIDVGLLGSLHYFSINLNSISVVNLTMALGLSVDYSAHLAHRFLDSSTTTTSPSSSSSQQRLHDATAATSSASTNVHTAVDDSDEFLDNAERELCNIGGPVFNAGISTLCAILPLGLAASQVFKVFFVLLTSIVVLGLAHGLVLLPVLYVLVASCRRRCCGRQQVNSKGVAYDFDTSSRDNGATFEYINALHTGKSEVEMQAMNQRK